MVGRAALLRWFPSIWDEGSNPLPSALFRNEPFGENVKELSHWHAEACGSPIVERNARVQRPASRGIVMTDFLRHFARPRTRFVVERARIAVTLLVNSP